MHQTVINCHVGDNIILMTVLTLHINCVLTSIFVFFYFYKYVYTTVLSFEIVTVDAINSDQFNSIHRL